MGRKQSKRIVHSGVERGVCSEPHKQTIQPASAGNLFCPSGFSKVNKSHVNLVTEPMVCGAFGASQLRGAAKIFPTTQFTDQVPVDYCNGGGKRLTTDAVVVGLCQNTARV